MQMIYKYKLEFQPIQIVKLPLKRILTIQIQDGTPCLWALVDTEGRLIGLLNRLYGRGTGIALGAPLLERVTCSLRAHGSASMLPLASSRTMRRSCSSTYKPSLPS